MKTLLAICITILTAFSIGASGAPGALFDVAAAQTGQVLLPSRP